MDEMFLRVLLVGRRCVAAVQHAQYGPRLWSRRRRLQLGPCLWQSSQRPENKPMPLRQAVKLRNGCLNIGRVCVDRDFGDRCGEEMRRGWSWCPMLWCASRNSRTADGLRCQLGVNEAPSYLLLHDTAAAMLPVVVAGSCQIATRRHAEEPAMDSWSKEWLLEASVLLEEAQHSLFERPPMHSRALREAEGCLAGSKGGLRGAASAALSKAVRFQSRTRRARSDLR